MAEPGAKRERRFRHRLGLDPPEASLATVERYLRQGDRPLRALLRQEGIETLAGGEILYRSRPFLVGPWQVVPRIRLRWQQQVAGLHIAGRAPVADGRGSEPETSPKAGKIIDLEYAYGLDVVLVAQAAAIEACGALWLESPLLSPGWVQPLAELVMRELQRRLLHRFERGLRRDFARWFADGKITSTSLGPLI